MTGRIADRVCILALVMLQLVAVIALRLAVLDPHLPTTGEASQLDFSPGKVAIATLESALPAHLPSRIASIGQHARDEPTSSATGGALSGYEPLYEGMASPRRS